MLTVRISIHAPARGATRWGSGYYSDVMISIHAPARGATFRNRYGILTGLFQSTLPRGERRLWLWRWHQRIHFNPRSREGSDQGLFLSYKKFRISIHAPARGATGVDWDMIISTPYFNPRSREGSDGYTPGGHVCVVISIHAPARGATVEIKKTFTILVISIHAPARGATSIPLIDATVDNAFQSTLPRGERLLNVEIAQKQTYFNPRSREGSDNNNDDFIDELSISIHAPARGATYTLDNAFPGICISIHSPARGATTIFLISSSFIRISIHAPARGATLLQPVSLPARSHFNPRSREGSDAESLLHVYRPPKISIHAPARGAT